MDCPEQKRGAAEMKSPRELPGCRAPSPLPQSMWDFHRPQLFPWDHAQASHSYWPCPRKPGGNHAANAPKSSKSLPQGADAVQWGPLLPELHPLLGPQSQKTSGSWAQLFLACGLSVSSRCLYICPAIFI